MEVQWLRGLDFLNAAMEGQPLAPIMQVLLHTLYPVACVKLAVTNCVCMCVCAEVARPRLFERGDGGAAARTHHAGTPFFQACVLGGSLSSSSDLTHSNRLRAP